MNQRDYPALYQAASTASARAQLSHLVCISSYGLLTVVGAGLTVAGISSKGAAVAAAVVFIAGLFVSVLMALKQYESTWYRCRAVAESIKTVTWRFMMRSEPFHETSLDDAKMKLQGRLEEVLAEHKDLGIELAGEVANQPQISTRMAEVFGLPMTERLAIYRKDRVQEQRMWYATKSASNVRSGKRWFALFVALQAAAIAFVLARIAWPEGFLWPIQALVVAATSVLGWIQVKRYRELGSAYAVAAHEIGLAEGGLGQIRSDKELSEYVEKTESVFSREHTQWVARKA